MRPSLPAPVTICLSMCPGSQNPQVLHLCSSTPVWKFCSPRQAPHSPASWASSYTPLHAHVRGLTCRCTVTPKLFSPSTNPAPSPPPPQMAVLVGAGPAGARSEGPPGLQAAARAEATCFLECRQQGELSPDTEPSTCPQG